MKGNASKRNNRPSPTPPTTNSTSRILSQIPNMRSASTNKSSSSSSPPTPPRPSKSIPATQSPRSKSIPLKSLNQSITSRLTTPSGARSSVGAGERALPSNYQSVARRVTMTIVALPVLLVTSWVLWDRLVLGEPKKSLIREPPVVPGPPMHAEMETRNKQR